MPRPAHHPQAIKKILVVGIQGVCGHILVIVLDTWIVGSGGRARNAHDHHCNHVPGTVNLLSLKQSERIGSLRRAFWLGRKMKNPCSCGIAKEGC
jgi:hypothetical protein